MCEVKMGVGVFMLSLRAEICVVVEKPRLQNAYDPQPALVGQAASSPGLSQGL